MKKAVTEDEIVKLIKNGASEVHLTKDDILTPLAIDRIRSAGLQIIRGGNSAQTFSSQSKKIVIGSDHTGVKAKKILVEWLKSKSCEVLDIGTYNEDSVDYPDIAFNAASRVANKEFDYGILIDATGIPSAITANKIPGIRAATCYNEFSAKSSREHNNANVLVLGAKSLGEETIKSVTDVWLNSNFLGDRHQRRLDKITAIEQKYSKNEM
ncbi:MAG: ribose 5-phosphate isomerase B [Ignavibacteriales bacterium]|nr:ribose 5-phosphate isomerase B [Ignavibacteriales bacterium]